MGALLSLLRSDYNKQQQQQQQPPSTGTGVTTKRTRSNVTVDASTSGNEVLVGRTLRGHHSLSSTTATTNSSNAATITANRRHSSANDNSNSNYGTTNEDQHARTSTAGGTGGNAASREVVFPDSFEVLPQPRDLSVVYMGVPHEQQRKFRCRFCGKGYRWKSTMRRHEMVECGGKPPAFQCPECPYKARQRGNLTVHYKRHHQKIEYDEGA